MGRQPRLKNVQADAVSSHFDYMFSCTFPSPLVWHDSNSYAGYHNDLVIISPYHFSVVNFFSKFRLAMTIEALS